MPTDEGFTGVSNCYVFKSRLQEYAQKMGHPTPVYETYKEGPCHEPYFRSTVIVNDVRYDSLPGFFNRKAAEQSAAEVALVELSKSSEVKECISVPVHETGLCKNLLQEYAQKMNFAIPMYDCQRDNMTSRVAYFSCTVEIGGMRYIGGAARTKKEAEIKAARTALLAIQSTSSDSSDGYSQLTVIPGKKRETESAKKSEETPSALKPKKGRFKKKKMSKQRRRGGAISNIVAESRGIIPGSNMNGLVSTGFQVASDVQVGIDSTINPKEVSTVNQSGGKVSVVVGDVQLGMESSTKAKEMALNVDPSGGEVSVVEGDVPLSVESSIEVKEVLNVDLSWGKVCGVVAITNGESLNGQSDAVQSYHQSPNDQTPFVPCGNQASVNAAMGPVEIPIVTTDLNGQSDADQSYHQRPNDRTPFVPCGNQASVNAATGPVEVPIVTTGLSQPGESIQAGVD